MHALDDIDLSVDEGHLVAVMGPSGSGKSTLLTIAGSLEEPTSGEVRIGGSVALERCPATTRRASGGGRIGYVFQDFNLLPGLTAAENVALPLELDGVPARKAHVRRASPRSSSSGWPTGPTHYPDQLSGGERQRVADRPGRGRRAPPPPRRRAVGCARLDERRGGDAR